MEEEVAQKKKTKKKKKKKKIYQLSDDFFGIQLLTDTEFLSVRFFFFPFSQFVQLGQ